MMIGDFTTYLVTTLTLFGAAGAIWLAIGRNHRKRSSS